MGLERECCFGFGHMFAVKDISKRENVFSLSILLIASCLLN